MHIIILHYIILETMVLRHISHVVNIVSMIKLNYYVSEIRTIPNALKFVKLQLSMQG
jgi:hypothetical protein